MEQIKTVRTRSALLVAAGMAVVICGCPETPTSTKNAVDKQPTKTDGTADTTPITLENADPKALTAIMEKHRGKVVIVDFWATWCIPCVRAFPHTLELRDKYADKGLVIITMCMMEPKDDTKAKALVKLKEYKMSCINLISAHGGEDSAYDEFGLPNALPVYQIYGREGKLAHSFDNTDPDHPFDHTDVEAEVKKQLGP